MPEPTTLPVADTVSTDADPYITEPTHLRVFSDGPVGDATAREWFVDGADDDGHMTEACWSYDTHAAALAALPEFARNQSEHNGVTWRWTPGRSERRRPYPNHLRE